MKTVKQIICALLVVTMLVVLNVGAFATEAITINDVTLEKYVDGYGFNDPSLLTVKVNFTATEGIEQISIFLTASDITGVSPETVSQIIYMTQIDVPENGEYEFTVEKSRISAATGLEDISGCTLYLKVGGTDFANMAKETIVYTDPEDVVICGDVTGDGDIDIGDAVQILRYEAGLVQFNSLQMLAADVTGDGDIDIGDAVRILRYEAGLITSLQ